MKLLKEINRLSYTFGKLNSIIENILLKILPSSHVFAYCETIDVIRREETFLYWQCRYNTSCARGENACTRIVRRKYFYADGTFCLQTWALCTYTLCPLGTDGECF